MSSDSKNAESGTRTQGGSLNELRGVEEVLNNANSILDREDEEFSEQELLHLLKQLDAAELVAEQIESRVDNILRNLENMQDGPEAEQRDMDNAKEARAGEAGS
ncbi:hypothetical protein CTheo_2055 [Ceratobasidium theobromae]|uniref:Uncharacterized protein n=1 Tax=Ceratobasidium theobromae TaxID=1582974 RepID=A0A5N5QS34_9AGAM|nr:hypothetical protein CTheo_2055 [Ceratobasidium theobromae]